MKNKQYPPRGGPPLVYRCRGSGWRDRTRVFPTAHFTGWRDFRIAHSNGRKPVSVAKNCFRIEDDVGPPGWQNRYGANGIAVGFNQRIENAYASHGLQPHLINMRLKPEELVCSILIRQLKQTAMEEKQTAIDNKAGRTCRKARHVGKTRDNPAAVYNKLKGKMSQRFGNTGPPPGRTDPNARKDIRHVREYGSGGWKEGSGNRKHFFGDRKFSLWDRKYPFGDWKYPSGNWKYVFGNRKFFLWERKYTFGEKKCSQWDWKYISGNWKDAGPPGGLPVPVWIPNPEGLGTQTLTGQKDAVRFTKKVAALDLTASAGWRTDNVECTDLKTCCKAREPAGQLPEKMCRSGTRMEAACVRLDIVIRIIVRRSGRLKLIDADSPDSYRGNDADRLEDEITGADLTVPIVIGTRPVNVEYRNRINVEIEKFDI